MIDPEQKAAIARINGAKSRGPKTAQGKQASAINAMKHGLRSEHMFVLQNEKKEGWDRMLAVCNEAFLPVTDYERELVEEIAAARWRLRRAWTVETGLFDIEMDRQAPALEETWDAFDEGTRLASAFTALADETRSLALLSRYETRLRRNFERAVSNLQAHRGNKKMPNEPTPGESNTGLSTGPQNLLG
jgi:hypothetical protein